MVYGKVYNYLSSALLIIILCVFYAIHVIGCSGFLLERPTCWRDTALQALPTNQSSPAEAQSRTTSHPCWQRFGTELVYWLGIGPIYTWIKLWEQVHYHALRLFLWVAWSCPTPIKISRRCSKISLAALQQQEGANKLLFSTTTVNLLPGGVEGFMFQLSANGTYIIIIQSVFLSGLKSRQVDSVKLPPIRCNPLNMRHQDFNIIFQPPKDATSGFGIIKKCRFKSRSYGIDTIYTASYKWGPHIAGGASKR